MSHRLRLYFGSGRSNTAPELDELEGFPPTRQQDSNGDAATTFRVQPQRRQPPPQQLGSAAPGGESSTLKRSSSMFIPQLTPLSEPRPTRSTSSMQISLQRSAGPGSAESPPPPCYVPRGPAPAYSEPGAFPEAPLPPPPPYYSGEAATVNSSGASKLSQSTEAGLPKRRVFSIAPHNGTSAAGFNGHSMDDRSPPGISFGGFCIRGSSHDGPEAQQFRISSSGALGGPRRWSVQQQNSDPGSYGGSQRVVFQLQDQGQGRQPNVPAQGQCPDLGSTGLKDGCVVRYPRIRLERGLSQPRLSTGNQDSQPTEEAQNGTEDKNMEVEEEPKGCTFKFTRENHKTQPHFKIYFRQGGREDQDLNFGNGQARNGTQVMNTKMSSIKLKVSYLFTSL